MARIRSYLADRRPVLRDAAIGAVAVLAGFSVGLVFGPLVGGLAGVAAGIAVGVFWPSRTERRVNQLTSRVRVESDPEGLVVYGGHPEIRDGPPTPDSAGRGGACCRSLASPSSVVRMRRQIASSWAQCS